MGAFKNAKMALTKKMSKAKTRDDSASDGEETRYKQPGSHVETRSPSLPQPPPPAEGKRPVRPARGGDEEDPGTAYDFYTPQYTRNQDPGPAPPAAAVASTDPAPFNPTYVATGEVIGRGGYGVVYHGVHQVTGENVAVKEFTGGFAMDAALIGGILRELAMLERLKHPQIVALRGHHVDKAAQRALIYLEYVSGGSLSSLLEKNGGRLFEGLIRRLSRDAVTGLQYLHQNDVVHRDIKPHNLLITSEGRVKVADFGCCKEICDTSSSTHSMVGTPRYMAPEAVQGGVSPAADVWSLGATIVELASGLPPWADVEKSGGHIALIFHIGMGKGKEGHHPNIPRHLSTEAVKVLKKCFAADPNQRFTAEDFLATDFLQDPSVPLAGSESIEDYNASRAAANQKTPSIVDVQTMVTISMGTAATDSTFSFTTASSAPSYSAPATSDPSASTGELTKEKASEMSSHAASSSIPSVPLERRNTALRSPSPPYQQQTQMVSQVKASAKRSKSDVGMISVDLPSMPKKGAKFIPPASMSTSKVVKKKKKK